MQIKRPLIWILASYLAGILLVNLPVTNVLFFFLGMIIVILLVFNQVRRKGKRLASYVFLLVLPLIFLLGFHLSKEKVKRPLIDNYFDEKIAVTLEGKVILIEEKGEYERLTLENVLIKPKNLKKADKSNIFNTNQVSDCFNSKKLIVYNSTEFSSYRLGNLILVSGTLKKFQTASNPGQFNEYEYYKNKGIDYKVYAETIGVTNNDYNIILDSIYKLKLKFQYVYKNILPKKQSGLLSAMILGDSNSLDSDINELYEENGISHIIAISGLHVSLLGLTLYKVLRKLRIPILLSTVFSVFLLYAYGILTNFSVSTNRSIVMLIVSMISLLVGRTYDLLSATALSALIILVQNPFEIYNAGFLLSFGAVISMGTIYPVIKNLIPWKNKLIDSILMSFSIQLVTSPILLYYFYEIPTYSIIINLIIIPLSSLVILLAIIAVLLGSIYLPFGMFFVGGAYFLLNFFEWVCKIGLNLPKRNIVTGRPDAFILVTYYFILATFLLINRSNYRNVNRNLNISANVANNVNNFNGINAVNMNSDTVDMNRDNFIYKNDTINKYNIYIRNYRRLSLVLLLFLLILFIKPNSSNLEVYFLDVGQGDGIVMRLPDSTTFLIDGGSTDVKQVGEYRIKPFLKFKGIEVIDYAVVTHLDTDHISGIIELIEEDGLIRHLVLPNITMKDETYMKMIRIAEQEGIKVLMIEKGDSFKIGEINISCLHPTKDFLSQSKNAYSTVLSLSYKDFDMLLTGDIEGEGEDLLVEEIINQQLHDKVYEVLKVAHHGSKNSTDEDFLTAISPVYSIISCGKNNWYGHPHKELLTRLDNIGSKVYITYKMGAIHIETDGKKLRISGYK